MPTSPIKIPMNLVPTFDAVSQQTGIPISVLAAVVQTQLGGFPNSMLPGQVVQIGQLLQQGGGTGDPYDPSWRPDWTTVATEVFGSGSSGWRSRFENILGPSDQPEEEKWVYDSRNPYPESTFHTPTLGAGIGGQRIVVTGDTPNLGLSRDAAAGLFEKVTGRMPSEQEISQYEGMRSDIAEHAIAAMPEAAAWRQNGERIADTRRWADSIAMQLTGKPLDNSQILDVAKNGWTPDRLTDYLRNQKVTGTDVTVGEASDVRKQMQDSWKRILGRAPTEGEINFAVTQKVPLTNLDALAEQTRDKTVWATDPDTYTTARKALQQVMAQNGIVVAEKDIDPNLVNQAAKGKWGLDQMRQVVLTGQQPGAPQGITVDKYQATKNVMDQVWKSYFPNTPLPQSYINQGLTMTPDQITSFVRSLPSPESATSKAGVVPIGVYTDAKNVAQQALAKLGVVGRDPTPEEIAMFAGQKDDVEAIQKHYATDPAVIDQNPGAQYGLTRESYYDQRRLLEQSYGQRFGQTQTEADVQAKQDNPTPGTTPQEPGWVTEIFKDKITPDQAKQAFDSYFTNQGRAPTADEIGVFQTRQADHFSDSIGNAKKPQPAFTNQGDLSAPGLGGPSSGFRG